MAGAERATDTPQNGGLPKTHQEVLCPHDRHNERADTIRATLTATGGGRRVGVRSRTVLSGQLPVRRRGRRPSVRWAAEGGRWGGRLAVEMLFDPIASVLAPAGGATLDGDPMRRAEAAERTAAAAPVGLALGGMGDGPP